MPCTINGPAPKAWARWDFNVICVGTKTVLDIDDLGEGHKVHTWGHDLTNINQIWHFDVVDPYANIWTLQSTRSKLFLEVEDGKVANGAEITSRSRKGGDDVKRRNQEWFIHLVEGAGTWPSIALQNVGTGLFLNVENMVTTYPSKITTWAWDGGLGSVWRLHQQLDKK